MKKFVFTNEKYQGVKEKEYERLKLDMKNVDKEIDAAMAVLARADAEFAAEQTRFEKACKEGIGAGEALCYQGFFGLLRERKRDVEQMLEALREKKSALSEQLLRIHNELKVLEEMRAEQYAAYCREVAADEAKELDEHMSFTLFERAV